jgi:hypothetical protein
MIRIAPQIVLLFLVPTIAYFAYALLARRGAARAAVFDEAPYAWLAVVGAVLVAAFLVYYGWTSTGGGIDPAAPARGFDGRPTPGGAK